MIRAKLVVRWVTTCEALVLNVFFLTRTHGLSFFCFFSFVQQSEDDRQLERCAIVFVFAFISHPHGYRVLGLAYTILPPLLASGESEIIRRRASQQFG